MGLIGGTDKGSIHLFTYPFNLDVGNGIQLASPLLDQITAHSGEVTKIMLSPDGRYLFSAGTDGSLFIFQVSDAPIMFDKSGQLINNFGDDHRHLEDDMGPGATSGGP
jgi:WD40 repeat protein